MSFRQLVRLPLMMLLCVSLAMSGCAGLGSGEPDDPNDVCLAQRKALRSTGDYFTRDIVEGAVGGALGGALIGGLATGNLRGAAIGAVAGGALGAIGGYWRARQQQYAQDQARLYESVYQDIYKENVSIDQTQQAFNNLIACRNRQAAGIRADYRAGRLSRDQASAMMASVRAYADSDLRLARLIGNNIQHRSEDFSYASREVRTTSSGGGGTTTARVSRPSRPSGSTQRAAVDVQTASSTNLIKRDQFEQSITRAQNNQSAFELSPA